VAGEPCALWLTRLVGEKGTLDAAMDEPSYVRFSQDVKTVLPWKELSRIPDEKKPCTSPSFDVSTEKSMYALSSAGSSAPSPRDGHFLITRDPPGFIIRNAATGFVMREVAVGRWIAMPWALAVDGRILACVVIQLVRTSEAVEVRIYDLKAISRQLAGGADLPASQLRPGSQPCRRD